MKQPVTALIISLLLSRSFITELLRFKRNIKCNVNAKQKILNNRSRIIEFLNFNYNDSKDIFNFQLRIFKVQ